MCEGEGGRVRVAASGARVPHATWSAHPPRGHGPLRLRLLLLLSSSSLRGAHGAPRGNVFRVRLDFIKYYSGL